MNQENRTSKVMSDLRKLFPLFRFQKNKTSHALFVQIESMTRSAIFSHKIGCDDLAEIELEVVDNMVDSIITQMNNRK